MRTGAWRANESTEELEEAAVYSMGLGEVHQPFLTASQLIWRTGGSVAGPIFALHRESSGDAPPVAELLFGGRSVTQVQAIEDPDGRVHLVFYDPNQREVHYAVRGS